MWPPIPVYSWSESAITVSNERDGRNYGVLVPFNWRPVVKEWYHTHFWPLNPSVLHITGKSTAARREMLPVWFWKWPCHSIYITRETSLVTIFSHSHSNGICFHSNHRALFLGLRCIQILYGAPHRVATTTTRLSPRLHITTVIVSMVTRVSCPG